MAVIALDLGGTKLAAALFTDCGRLTHRTVSLLDGRNGHAVAKLCCDAALSVAEVARSKRLRITGVGVSVPGISHPGTGTVWAPNIPGWTRFPLRRVLARAIAARGVRVPIEVESDRACGILGERWCGAARGCRDAIFLAVGTGIGAGILAEGQILRGTLGTAGAIGWLALDRPFRPEYVSCGCFEHHGSGEGLSKVASEMAKKSKGERSDAFTAAEIFSAYDRGDALARAVVDEAISYWGMAVANLVSLFNPEKIIFGGGVFGPALKFLPRIRREASQWAQPLAMRKVKLQASALGGDAPLYGAAYLTLRTSSETK